MAEFPLRACLRKLLRTQCKGELDREETGNAILIGELSGMRLAPTNRAACKRCGTKFEKGELCKSR